VNEQSLILEHSYFLFDFSSLPPIAAIKQRYILVFKICKGFSFRVSLPKSARVSINQLPDFHPNPAPYSSNQTALYSIFFDLQGFQVWYKSEMLKTIFLLL
jgi:hypothetical protein